MIKGLPSVDPQRHVDAADGCMQWILSRLDGRHPWQPVGYASRYTGALVKVNGSMRRTELDMHRTYTYRSFNRQFYQRKVPLELETSGARAVVSKFTPRSSFAEAAATFRDDGSISGDGVVHALSFAQTGQVDITNADGACSLIKARCRRYEFRASIPSHWWVVTHRAGSLTLFEKGADIESTGPDLREFAIEDVCPFARDALVERQYSKGGGQPAAVKAFGLSGNASLREALQPYAR